jgi:hypothetical protein
MNLAPGNAQWKLCFPRPGCSANLRELKNRLLIVLFNALIGGVVDSELGLGNDRLIP